MARVNVKDWLTDEGLMKIQGWAMDGLTDEQIAMNIGCSVATIYNWKNKHLEILEALKKGKEVIDRQVENALLKRALGYEYVEVTKERIVDTGQKERHGGESELTQDEWEMAQAYFKSCCAYCGRQGQMTKDHLDPLKNNGKLIASNVIPACRSCNSSKKDNQWLAWFQKQSFYSKERANKIAEYVEFILSLPKNKDDELGELVVTKEVIKQVAPDTTAQIFWLKNRKPTEWRDKRDVEHSGEITSNHNVMNNMTEDELRKLTKLGGD